MNVQSRIETGSARRASPLPSVRAEPGWSQREYAVALLVTAAFWAAAALRWPLGNVIVPWDSKAQFYAFFRFLGKAAELGSPPYWNPFHYGGHPSIADPQSLVFNPIYRLLSLVAPNASLFLFDLTEQFHLLIGGLAMVLLGRRFGLRPTGAVLAALVFMLGGSASSRLQHVGEIMSYAAFPLALLLLDLALDRRSYLAAIGFGIIAGVMALGRDQIAYLFALALLAYAVTWLMLARPFWTALRRLVPILLVCGLVGLSIITIPILLTLQFAELSNRPEIGYDIAVMGSLYPANLATLFNANIFGTYDLPYDYFGPGYETRPLIDSTDRAINYLFAGTLTPLLVLLVPRLATLRLRFCLAVLVASVIYAIGGFTPIFEVLYLYMPGVDLYRRPADATFVMNAMIALLAGASLSHYERHGLRPPSVMRIAALVVFGAVPMLAGVWFASLHKEGMHAFRELVPTLLVYAAAAVLLVKVKRAPARLALAALVMIGTGIELNLQNAVTLLNSEPRQLYADLEEPTGEAAKAMEALRAALRTDIEQKELRSRTEMMGLGGPWQNIAMVQGFESTNGYNPLRIGGYDTLLRPGQNSHVLGDRKFTPSLPTLDSPLGRREGLRYIFISAPKSEIPLWYIKDFAKLKPIFTGEQYFIYKLPQVLPRTALVDRVVRIPRPDPIEPDSYPPGDHPEQVYIYTDTELSGHYAPDAPWTSSATITLEKPDRIEITFSTDQPAILTLNNTYYPGWTVEVDGKRKPLLETNLIYQGVEVSPGETRAVFRYEPLSAENLVAIVRNLLHLDDGAAGR